MTEYNVNIPKGRVQRTSKGEFSIYFAVIFAVALPIAVLGWLATPVLRGRLADVGPLKRARNDARAITPMIFRA